MISFEEAVSLVRAAARPAGAENVILRDAHGRVLAAPIAARVTSPPCDVSAMDGYAVREVDLGTYPVRLRLAGESFAGGGHSAALGPGECVRIFTGAPVPAGADRVVIQEVVRREGATALIDRHPGPARHIRPRGSDFGAGDQLLDKGRRLDARAMVAAAAGDVAEVEVWRRPHVLVLATGDELVEPGAAIGRPGGIPESVSFGVAGLAEDWGGVFAGARRLRDDLPSLEQVAAQALDAADLVVVTGGASVGERDFAKAMFEPSGLELVFAKVAIKPGKPVWLGRARDRLVMGLPGNPTSALVTARLLLAPLLARLSGDSCEAALLWRRLPLGGPLSPCGDRETFVRARLENGLAVPVGNQDSSAQKALAAADLLVRRRPGAPAAAAGEEVEVLDF